MKIDVLAIGELLADVISEHYVTTLAEAGTFHIYQGGSPANVCANLKWLGDHAVMVSCIGKDSIGDMIVDSIKKSDYPMTIFPEAQCILLRSYW